MATKKIISVPSHIYAALEGQTVDSQDGQAWLAARAVSDDFDLQVTDTNAYQDLIGPETDKIVLTLAEQADLEAIPHSGVTYPPGPMNIVNLLQLMVNEGPFKKGAA